jgi:hypothetical protein
VPDTPNIYIKMHNLFIVFKVVYDNTDGTMLYFAMEEMQIPMKAINLVRAIIR